MTNMGYENLAQSLYRRRSHSRGQRRRQGSGIIAVSPQKVSNDGISR